MSKTNEVVESPCVSICIMDDDSGLCQGCYRTLEEIEQWWGLETSQQKEILLKASERESQQFD